MWLGRFAMAQCSIPWQMFFGFIFLIFFTIILLLFYTATYKLLSLATTALPTSQIPYIASVNCCYILSFYIFSLRYVKWSRTFSFNISPILSNAFKAVATYSEITALLPDTCPCHLFNQTVEDLLAQNTSCTFPSWRLYNFRKFLYEFTEYIWIANI